MNEELILILGEAEDELYLTLGEEGENLVLSLSELGGSDIPPYTGNYEVTPTFSEQTLETLGKRMTADVTVHQIPVTTTTNPYGGNTVVIG